MTSLKPDAPTMTMTDAVSVAPTSTPAALQIVHPVSLGQWIPLTDRGGVLGRSPDTAGGEALPAIGSGRVSRAHAEIAWDARAGRHSVRDLGSRNGAWLDGERLTTAPVWLEDGAVLRLGDVLLVYSMHPGLAVEPPDTVDEAVAPGDSGVMRQLRFQLAQMASDPAPALVVGETGTGKERICRALHSLSDRRGNLVAENCATIERSIAESRLFGHKRGAFTGAESDYSGLFREAHRGTLFLDEIGELPLEVQAKLLRALEQGEITPLGATRTVSVDVRVVAATHQPLFDMVGAGRFRQDLYARLALWQLDVPPLRARRGDILSWVSRLHSAWAQERGRSAAPLELHEEAAEALLLHPWRDNLREVKRVIHRLAMALEATQHVGPVPLSRLQPHLAEGGSTSAYPAVAPAASSQPPSAAPRPKQPKPTAEELTEALERLGSVRATAKHYGRDRRQIYRWLEQYGLKAPSEG